jgi:hypothetical protein
MPPYNFREISLKLVGIESYDSDIILGRSIKLAESTTHM